MLVPTKFTRLEESTIFKMRYILIAQRENQTISELFEKTKHAFYDASEFLHALDILFVLGILDVHNEFGVVEYA